jgi:hypothetical protein
MAKPILALKRLSLDEDQGKVIYQYGQGDTTPLTCPACGAQMKPIAFVTNYAVIDKIIHHLGITFTAKRPPPAAQQEELY